MNFIGLINFSCCLLATYFCYCFLLVSFLVIVNIVVLKVSIVMVARQHSNHCTLKMVSMVIVYMTYLSVSCLKTVSIVTVGKQHLNYIT